MTQPLQPIQNSMQVELPTTRTVTRRARTVNVPAREIQIPIPPEIIQRREIDPSFDKNNPGRWNRNFMTTLNIQKIRYDQRMLNPLALIVELVVKVVSFNKI